VENVMVKDINDLIRELSDVYDPDSLNTFVTLYLDKKHDKRFLEKRIHACKTVLKGEELSNFLGTIDDIHDIVNKNIGDNIAVFASRKHSFQKFYPLPIKTDSLLVVDSSPYIRPLARVYDEWEDFTLILVSSNYAKIFSVSLGKVEQTKRLSADIMNKHKKGGCSQARFNRLRRGAIHAFLSEVVEELKERADERIIVAGPGIEKNHFIDMLPKDLKDKVVDIIDINVDDETKLLKQSYSLISQKEKEKSSEAVQHLKEEVLRDGLAVYGLKETIKAVKNGQVELLLIQKDFKPRGWICEHCQVVEKGIKKTCPYCGNKTSEVDVLEEILEFAKRTDAEIEFTDSEELADLGHVGGILRFK
jgi:peptide chain release factor subunit 1